jgi:hypothetical protein
MINLYRPHLLKAYESLQMRKKKIDEKVGWNEIEEI